jgi:tRNA U34 5-methylaminomethyl-2-thiouridine-forming methyltransferase MnmC
LLLPRRGADGSFSLYSPSVGEGFHSAEGALLEARMKFVAPAVLERFGVGRALVVVEVAVGTGTNTATLLEASRAAGLELDWWGLELDPRPLALALADAGFRSQWPGWVSRRLAQLGGSDRLLLGDARRRLPELLLQLEGRCDLVLLDAFSPRRCPQLWSLEFLERLVRLLGPEGRLLTYCSAAAVRRCLLDLGLQLAAIRPALSTPGRWSAGSVAGFSPPAAHPSLRPLAAMELEHLATRAAEPYRDSTGTAEAAAILEARRSAQALSGAEPASAWARRWQCQAEGPPCRGLGRSGEHR